MNNFIGLKKQMPSYLITCIFDVNTALVKTAVVVMTKIAVNYMQRYTKLKIFSQVPHPHSSFI
jgi:hypothetical protein